MNGTNPFGGSSSAPKPGGGGSYLSCDENKQPARHIVMLSKLEWREPGFVAKMGAAIANFTLLCTDAVRNHKVGADYAVYHGFDKALGKGNCVVDLAAYRSVILGRPVQAAEITDEMLAAAYGVKGFSLAEHDPEVFNILGEAGYRGVLMVAVSRNKLTKAGGDFTITSFFPMGDMDVAKFAKEQPDLYAQCYPDQGQAAG